MDSFVHIPQKANSVLKLLRCAIAAIEITGDGVDFAANIIHEVNEKQ